MESIIISMVQCMKDIGEMIYNMAQEKKVGQMAQFMKENMLPVKSMDLDCTVGLMVLNTKENGLSIR